MIVTLATMTAGRHPKAVELERALDRARKSANWLAKAVGVPRQSLYRWLSGETEPRDADIWDRLLAAVPPPASVELVAGPRIPVGYAPLPMRFAGVVPASGAWGDPLSSEEFIEVDAKYAHPKRFAAQLIGSSCWPALQQGDLTIWHSDEAPANGLIILAQQLPEHRCTVKQLVLDPGGNPVLKAVNPKESPPPHGDGWYPIARLVAVMRMMGRVERSWYNPGGLHPDDLA